MIRLSRIRLDSDPARMLEAQQMIYNLKPLLPLREINAAKVHEAFEFALRVVAQKSEDRNYTGRGDVQGEFVFEDGELLDELGKTLSQIGSIGMKRFRRFRVQSNGRVGRCRLCEGAC